MMTSFEMFFKNTVSTIALLVICRDCISFFIAVILYTGFARGFNSILTLNSNV